MYPTTGLYRSLMPGRYHRVPGMPGMPGRGYRCPREVYRVPRRVHVSGYRVPVGYSSRGVPPWSSLNYRLV